MKEVGGTTHTRLRHVVRARLRAGGGGRTCANDTHVAIVEVYWGCGVVALRHMARAGGFLGIAAYKKVGLWQRREARQPTCNTKRMNEISRKPAHTVTEFSLVIEQSTPGFSNSRIRVPPHVHQRSPGSRPGPVV